MTVNIEEIKKNIASSWERLLYAGSKAPLETYVEEGINTIWYEIDKGIVQITNNIIDNKLNLEILQKEAYSNNPSFDLKEYKEGLSKRIEEYQGYIKSTLLQTGVIEDVSKVEYYSPQANSYGISIDIGKTDKDFAEVAKRLKYAAEKTDRMFLVKSIDSYQDYIAKKNYTLDDGVTKSGAILKALDVENKSEKISLYIIDKLARSPSINDFLVVYKPDENAKESFLVSFKIEDQNFDYKKLFEEFSAIFKGVVSPSPGEFMQFKIKDDNGKNLGNGGEFEIKGNVTKLFLDIKRNDPNFKFPDDNNRHNSR